MCYIEWDADHEASDLAIQWVCNRGFISLDMGPEMGKIGDGDPPDCDGSLVLDKPIGGWGVQSLEDGPGKLLGRLSCFEYFVCFPQNFLWFSRT